MNHLNVFLISPFSWKDPNCVYRKDPRTHLVFLPTLLRWKSPQRLDGSKVSDAGLVEMLLADEDWMRGMNWGEHIGFFDSIESNALCIM